MVQMGSTIELRGEGARTRNACATCASCSQIAGEIKKCIWFHIKSKEENHHRATAQCDTSMHQRLWTDGDMTSGVCTNIFILSGSLCHELVGDGLQQLWLVLLGADEVSAAGRSRLRRQKWGDVRWSNSKPRQELNSQFIQKAASPQRVLSYLALQFHPAALLLGLHLLSLVLLDALQETVPALWVLHVLNAHVNPLGQDPAPVGDAEFVFKNRNLNNTPLTFQDHLDQIPGTRNNRIRSVTAAALMMGTSRVERSCEPSSTRLWGLDITFFRPSGFV